MKFKALLFDFYGTLVEEADAYVENICARISRHLDHKVFPREISKQWFEIVPKMCYEAYGKKFRLQKDIAVESLETVLHSLRCGLDAHELIKTIHKYWNAPRIFPESRYVLERCNLPIYIISNVDDEFIYRALDMHGLRFSNVVTSESCRSYKPRVDIF
jgi:FMN phosphatase YigB (HAD superfamily)